MDEPKRCVYPSAQQEYFCEPDLTMESPESLTEKHSMFTDSS
jgi:hypothetical protein